MINSYNRLRHSDFFCLLLVAIPTSQPCSSTYQTSHLFSNQTLFNMPSASLPVIIIVPGAFGTPQGFEKLLPYLTKAGYATHPGSYPSCNPSDPASVSSSQDIASLRDNILLPLLNEEGKDIVIIAHSYGGVVAGGAARELAKETRRAQGHSTGIIGLIYVVGNITLDGESLLAAVGGAYPPFIKVDQVRSTQNNRDHTQL